MEFIKEIEGLEEADSKLGKSYYRSYVILCCVEITEEEYNKWKGQF